MLELLKAQCELLISAARESEFLRLQAEIETGITAGNL
jgi:hypothetical protein